MNQQLHLPIDAAGEDIAPLPARLGFPLAS
jgi:hypothetical protein